MNKKYFFVILSLIAICCILYIKISNYENNLSKENKIQKYSSIDLSILKKRSFLQINKNGSVSYFKLQPSSTKLIIFNFWATWCKACMAELPYLYKLADKQGLQLIMISLDQNNKKLISAIQGFPNNIIVIKDQLNYLQKLFAVTRIPKSFIISAELKLLDIVSNEIRQFEYEKILRYVVSD